MSKLMIAMLVAGSMGLAACEPYEETVEAPPPPPPAADADPGRRSRRSLRTA